MFAYNCRPLSGSDPGLGWQWAELAGRHHRVRVFTRDSNRAEIEKFGGLPGVEFEYVEMGERHGRFGIGSPWYDAQHCLRWMRRAVDRALDLHRADPFDLTHFATFSAFWMPGPFHRFERPHLGGVFTGGETTDPAFAEYLDDAGRRSDRIRNGLMTLSVRHPDWRKTHHQSQPVKSVVESAVLKERMTAAGALDVSVFRPPMSMSRDLRSQLEQIRVGTPKAAGVTLAASGRQVAWKGFRWAIEALSIVREEHAEAVLHLVGDGPDHEDLVRRADEAGLAEFVTFHRTFSFEEERRLIAESNVFLFPSQRDGGAAVLQFAMALGTPIVGFPIGAAPDVAGDVVHWVDPKSSEPGRALAVGVNALLADATERERLVSSGLHRLDQELSEDRAAEALDQWYDDITRAQER